MSEAIRSHVAPMCSSIVRCGRDISYSANSRHCLACSRQAAAVNSLIGNTAIQSAITSLPGRRALPYGEKEGSPWAALGCGDISRPAWKNALTVCPIPKIRDEPSPRRQTKGSPRKGRSSANDPRVLLIPLPWPRSVRCGFGSLCWPSSGYVSRFY